MVGQKRAFFLFVRFIWCVLLSFCERLSFFSLASTCFAFLPSLPLALLNFLVTMYLFSSLSPLFYLSYILLTCLNLLTSLIPYWFITTSAFFWTFFSFFCILIFFRTLAYMIFLGILAFIAINRYFYWANYYFVIGSFLKLCFFSSSVNHFGRLSWS